MLQIMLKAGNVLDLFSVKKPEWGVSEVAHVLGMPKSSVCEIMTSLANQGLLSQTNMNRYRLGWRLFELSRTLQETTDFYPEAHQEMQRLADRWGEAVHLSVLEGQRVVHIERMYNTSNVPELISRMSMRLPTYCSSVGKVLLAEQEWSEVIRTFKGQKFSAFTSKTITTLDELADELTLVRKQGYAYDDEEVLPGLCCVSAPIHNLNGRVIAGVSLIVPSKRFYQQRENYAAAICKTAESISTKIGYQKKKQRASRSLTSV